MEDLTTELSLLVFLVTHDLKWFASPFGTLRESIYTLIESLLVLEQRFCSIMCLMVGTSL